MFDMQLWPSRAEAHTSMILRPIYSAREIYGRSRGDVNKFVFFAVDPLRKPGVTQKVEQPEIESLLIVLHDLVAR